MKIVQPSVTLLTHTPEPERLIEKMGRICYQSSHKVKMCGQCAGHPRTKIGGFITYCQSCNGTGTDKESAIKFIEMIKTNQHESVLEHPSASFSVVCDRGVSHELVRHRIASFSQESTRYVNYEKDQFGKEISVIEPPGLSIHERSHWLKGCQWAEDSYFGMLSTGSSPQIARSVLPNSLKTQIGVSCNFREFRHFLKLRTSPKAHPQMREIAEMIRAELLKISEVCFNDIP
jgi:thymidylate synthase (FAD)